MIIAFMGNDGSGKTTIAKELEKIFGDLGFEVVYKHEYQYNILRLLFGIIGMKKIESERKKMIIEKSTSWKYYFWPFLVWLDIFLSYVYFKICKRKAIVILDRYLFDHYVSFKYLGYLNMFSKWLFLHSIRPNAMFLLWIEPQIAYMRKKETHFYEMDFYIQQTKEYLKLSASLGIKAINTNKSIGKTIGEIVEALPAATRNAIWKRGWQNRVLFSVAKKYEINLPHQLNTKLQNRQKKLRETFNFIRDFFGEEKDIHYRIIKTSFQPLWVGNDVDIITSHNELIKIVATFKKLNLPNVKLKQKRLDEGKVDVILLNGLSIDLHSFIGWRNVAFVPSEAILDKEYLVEGERGLFFTTQKINGIIIVLTQIFEKGFITLDEHNFLKDHFNGLFIQSYFSYLNTILSDYIPWMQTTLLEKQPRSYPLFIPMHIIIKCYSKLLHSRKEYNNLPWIINALVRGISFMIFWRIRYYFKNTLPFEIDLSAQ